MDFPLLAADVVGADKLCFANLKKLDLQLFRHGLVFESDDLTTLASGMRHLEELVNLPAVDLSVCQAHTPPGVSRITAHEHGVP